MAGTFTYCQLYEALETLQEAYVFLSDVVAGLRCEDDDCAQRIEVPSTIGPLLPDFDEKYKTHIEKIQTQIRRPPCQTAPNCQVLARDLQSLADDTAALAGFTKHFVTAVNNHRDGKGYGHWTGPTNGPVERG